MRPHSYIIRDYKSFNSRVNARLTLLLYVCVAHTHEPYLNFWWYFIIYTNVVYLNHKISCFLLRKLISIYIQIRNEELAGTVAGFQRRVVQNNRAVGCQHFLKELGHFFWRGLQWGCSLILYLKNTTCYPSTN